MENLNMDLYSGSAIGERGVFVEGFNQVTRQASARHQRRVLGAAEMWADFQEGRLDPFYMRQAFRLTESGAFDMLCRRYPAVFQETMTTSDFNALTVDVLDRELLGDYTEVPIPVLPLVKKATLNDFRLKKIFIMDGLEQPFSAVNEMQDLPLGDLAQRTAITYNALKYEKGAKISWEAVINDDLGIFRDVSNRLARGARRTKHKFITGLYAGLTGPNSTLYSSTFKNQLTIANGASINNPPLTVQGLADAMTVLMNQVDVNGDPIEIPGKLFLVVGPSLFVTAQNLMHQLAVYANTLGGTLTAAGSGATASNYNALGVKVDNWLVQNMTVIMDPYLPIVTTTAGTKLTQWYVFADPAEQGRPAIEIGDLKGFDTPQLYEKVPNTMRVGGGVEPMLGDFQTMSTEFKALIAFGGVQLDGRSTVASTGQSV